MENFNWITSVLIPYANLALFLFLAVKILKGPISGAISGRKDEYINLLKEANKAKEEAEATQRAISEKLSSLNREVEEIKLKAKGQAEKDAEVIVKNAETLAQHLTSEAQRIADAEIEKAKLKLRRDIIAGIKEKVSGKILAELSPEKQQNLFQEKLRTLDKVRGEV